MLIEATNISHNFGKRQVLDDVSIKITNHSKIGLIGVNGAGKSTLLKILIGELEPQQGEVFRASHINIKVLTQNPKLTAGNTLKQELESVFTYVNILRKEEEELSNKLMTASEEEFDEILKELGDVQHKLEDYDADKIEAKIGKMVTGLGFSLDELDHHVDKFSGGWQMRINLAKVLLEEPDLILMDEPTNHLDLEAIDWLEEFLLDYPNGILLVSHDRYFLNQIVNEIAELDRGKLNSYKGNYSEYVEQRNSMRTLQAATAARQKKSMEKQMEFVNRFRASAAKSKQAKSREKQLKKIQVVDVPVSEQRKIQIQFPLENPSARDVFHINDLAKSFGTNKLFSDVNLKLEWLKDEAQRVFILGANGCGKTTFLKMLMGLEDPDTGSIDIHERTKIGYYSQNQLQTLDYDKTLVRTIEELMQNATQTDVRGVLGRFLFSGDQVFKEVGLLSGGEKARLAIAKLMLGAYNTLLLDEPTNHLDTIAQESLEDAMESYQGTIICISHDRYLINNHATQIWEFVEGSLIVHKSSYADYLEKRDFLIDQMREKKIKAAKARGEDFSEQEEDLKEKTLSPAKQAKEREKQVKKMEREIKELNTKKANLSVKIADPKLAEDYKELEKLSTVLGEVENRLMEIEAEWLEFNEIV